jgi:hypothetical protein
MRGFGIAPDEMKGAACADPKNNTDNATANMLKNRIADLLGMRQFASYPTLRVDESSAS